MVSNNSRLKVQVDELLEVSITVNDITVSVIIKRLGEGVCIIF